MIAQHPWSGLDCYVAKALRIEQPARHLGASRIVRSVPPSFVGMGGVSFFERYAGGNTADSSLSMANHLNAPQPTALAKNRAICDSDHSEGKA
jgi:hypothetical protein